MLTATSHDGPAFHTRNKTTQHNMTQDLPPQTDTVTPDITNITETPDSTPKHLTKDGLQALLQMQRTDPLCKCISKCLSSGKAPKHEVHLFLHIKGLLYKHVHGFKPDVLGSCHTKIMEIYSAHGST